MDDLMKNEAFTTGITVGIHLHQQRIIAAHERGEPVAIGEELFYFQDSREQLQEMFDKICR